MLIHPHLLCESYDLTIVNLGVDLPRLSKKHFARLSANRG